MIERLRRRILGLDGHALDVTRARLRMRAHPVVLECGANDGTDTNRFLARWPGAEVHCFEPEPRAAERWRANVVSDRARLHEVAIGERDGEATFHRSSGHHPDGNGPWDQSGSLRRPTGHLERWTWVTFTETLTVATRSLDSWAADHGIGAVDLVWADVQGAEGTSSGVVPRRSPGPATSTWRPPTRGSTKGRRVSPTCSPRSRGGE